MDNRRNSMFGGAEDESDDGRKKHLFSNRVNVSDSYYNADGYLNRESVPGYLPEKTSKLWNHITTKPYLAETTLQSFAPREVDDGGAFNPYRDYLSKSSLTRANEYLMEDKIEAVSDVFSETGDASMLNRIHSLSLRGPSLGVSTNRPQETPSQPVGMNVVYPNSDRADLAYLESSVQKMYNNVTHDDNKYIETNYSESLLRDSNYEVMSHPDVQVDSTVATMVDQYPQVAVEFLESNSLESQNLHPEGHTDTGYFESEYAENGPESYEPEVYSMSSKYNPLTVKSYADVHPLTAQESVKAPQPIGGTQMKSLEELPKLEIPETLQTKKVHLTSGPASVNSDMPNPFNSTSLFGPGSNKTGPSDLRPSSNTSLLNARGSQYSGDYSMTVLKDRGTAYNMFARDHEVISYTNYIDYNPFSVFSIKSSPAGVVSENDLKKLRSVILSSSHSEETMVKYFTEAICITNTQLMSQIVEFFIGIIAENHKARKFVVRLLLCGLSFHPEEFIASFKVEYLNVLFTPAIDDNIGIHFLKLLLSYKSTFNSKTEVDNNIPVSVNPDGNLVYTDLRDAPSDSHRDGKIESLYILKILLERNKVTSVFNITNSILREQLCIMWHEMPKTIPNVNVVEMLMHWINSKEDLETKKYPFLLLEKIRDLHQFPKGHTLLLSQFFLFALKHNANINNHLEYLITLVNNGTIDQYPSTYRTQRNSHRSERPSYRTPSVEHGSRRDSVHSNGFEEFDPGTQDILSLVLYRILSNFNEPDLLDLWCLLCVIPWKVTSPTAPFSNLFSSTLSTILKVTSGSYDNYTNSVVGNKVRLDILENCLRICLVRCSCPVNSLNTLLQTTLLINPATGGRDNPEAQNLVVASLSKNGMILGSLCGFLWKCHFLWTRIKEGVNIEIVILVTELYKILSGYTTAKPLDTNHSYNLDSYGSDIYKFFDSYSGSGLWTKITTFIPQIDLNQYFSTLDLPRDPRSQFHSSREGQARDHYMGTASLTPHDADYNRSSDQGAGYMVHDGYEYPSTIKETKYDVRDSDFYTRQVVGLKNLGNSCYMNSLIQALYHTKYFVYNLHMHRKAAKAAERAGKRGAKGADEGRSAMASALLSLFRKMSTSERKSLSPKAVFKLFSDNLSKSQQDVTEAIRFMSEAIDPELELWKSVFAGLVVRRIKCLRCGGLSDNEETMYDFSLPLNKAKTVQQMLDNFSAVETLSGENKYFCLNCNKDVKANMWNVIASPPSHLIIILNRNLWTSNETQKVLKRVKIDAELFITGFQYRLYGSIIHSGGSTESGHYYFIGCESESFLNWHNIDDSTIRKATDSSVDEISRDSSNTHVPYVLFYRCLQAPQTPKF